MYAPGHLIQTSDMQFDQSYTQPTLPQHQTPKPSLRFHPTNNHNMAQTLSNFEISNLRQNHQPSPLATAHLPQPLPTLDSCLPSEEFLYKRNAHRADRMYTLEDWKMMKNDLFQASDRIQAGSELSRAEVERTMNEVDVSMTKNQKDSEKGMEDCENNIKHCKDEVEKEMKKLTDSIEKLEKEVGRLSKLLGGTEDVLEVVMACLQLREEKQEIERVVDVDPDLLREAELLRNYQKNIREKISQINDQIRRNKAHRDDMSSGVMRMFEAASLLAKCRGMKEGTSIFRKQMKPINLPTPICWSDEASSLVGKSQKLRSDSQSLLDSSDEMVNNQSEMFLNQWRNTNERLNYRLEDYRSALHGLSAHLEKTLKELALVDGVMMGEVKRRMRRRGEVECLAEERVDVLHKGSVVECGPPSMNMEPGKALIRLQKELENLDLNLTDLNGKMRELEWVKGVLVRTKRALEHDITLKQFSQHIDSEVLAKRRGIKVESMVFSPQKL